jgi:hypothetical protein
MPHLVNPLILDDIGMRRQRAKHTLAASNSFISKERGKNHQLIHEEWDYGMHRLKFTKDDCW